MNIHSASATFDMFSEDVDGMRALYGAVVQLVRISACHAGGRGFESRPLRQLPLGNMAHIYVYICAKMAG